MTLYDVGRFLVAVFVRSAFRLEVVGAERVPRDGGLVVAANHVSNLDPPILGVALPRPVWYMAKKELFAIPVLGPLIARLNAFPVDRQAGGTAALRASLRLLRDGKCVGVFPEGGRNVTGDNEIKGGAVFLAAAAGVPIVPAAIVGTGRLRPFARIRVVFGEPLRIERDRQAKEADSEKWATVIMERIQDLGGATR